MEHALQTDNNAEPQGFADKHIELTEADFEFVTGASGQFIDPNGGPKQG